MAETVRVAVERQQLEALWDAELGRIGKGAVIAKLGGTSRRPRSHVPAASTRRQGRPQTWVR